MNANGRITGIPQALKSVLGVLGHLSDAPVFEEAAKILARHFSGLICLIKITLKQLIVKSLVT